MLIQRRHLLIGGMAAGVTPRVAAGQGARTAFQNADGKIRVPVRVGGVDIATVLDSGAGYNAMDAALARDFHVASGERVNLSAIGGTAHGRLSAPLDVALAGQALAQTRFAIFDLGGLSASVGQPVDLILGAPLFDRFVVDIDFEAHTLALNGRAAFAPPAGAAILALSPAGGLMTARIDLPGGSIEATVDTGSDAPLILSPAAARRLGVLRQGPVSTALIAGVGGAAVGQITSVPQVRFAGRAFADMPVQVAADDFGAQGNIGCGLLSRFRIWLDFGGRRMALSPGAADGAFKRDLTGLKASPEGAALKVSHVAKGGPGQAAGFRQGDLIVTIDGEPAGRANERLAAAPAGRVLTLTLQDGRTKTLTLARYY